MENDVHNIKLLLAALIKLSRGVMWSDAEHVLYRNAIKQLGLQV